ncbi:hypothetical protein JG688_00002652, partial [Phytophthora aleatoria]
NINVTKLARLTVSDTTGSAKHVSDHFSDSDQVDYLMHLTSLCLLCALGLKENTRKDGIRVIQKLRDLATFFSFPSRAAKLKQIKAVYSLPDINIGVDANTRIGYAVKLMRRSIFNNYAFTKYFESAPENGQGTWLNISKEDWKLISEMEGITDQLAEFSLGEVKIKTVSSTYGSLFRKIISLSLEAETIDCLVFERPHPKGNEFSYRREPNIYTPSRILESDAESACVNSLHCGFQKKTLTKSQPCFLIRVSRQKLLLLSRITPCSSEQNANFNLSTTNCIESCFSVTRLKRKAKHHVSSSFQRL